MLGLLPRAETKALLRPRPQQNSRSRRNKMRFARNAYLRLARMHHDQLTKRMMPRAKTPSFYIGHIPKSWRTAKKRAVTLGYLFPSHRHFDFAPICLIAAHDGNPQPDTCSNPETFRKLAREWPPKRLFQRPHRFLGRGIFPYKRLSCPSRGITFRRSGRHTRRGDAPLPQ